MFVLSQRSLLIAMWHLILVGLLATGTQAFAPAPLQWGGLSGRRFALATKSLPNTGLFPHMGTALPLRLTIREQTSGSSPEKPDVIGLHADIPYFAAKPDKTIVWEATGLCLEASGRKHGDVLRVNRCTGGSTQLWNILHSDKKGGNQLQLQGTSSCIIVNDRYGLNEAEVELQECANELAELWALEEPIPLPTRQASELSSISSPMRHAMLSFVALAVLGAYSLIGWSRWLSKARAVAVGRCIAPVNTDQGGVCLTMPVDARQSATPFIPNFDGRVESAVPAVMAMSTITTEDTTVLPKNWTEQIDDQSGQKFYYNDVTGESTWERPKESAVGEFKAIFKAGQLGVDVKTTTGLVQGVRGGSQAEQKGVLPGMVIRAIQGQPYSEKLMREKMQGSEDYELTITLQKERNAGSGEVLRPRRVVQSGGDTRLPVWPAWYGIFYNILDLLGQKKLAAAAEEKFGGRVCPMMLNSQMADPFILMVHHRHSWFRFDPIRPLFRALLPEGFPAHPHRGFETVTYVLPKMRGLIHRDSEGLKMEYGDGECQWMTAGSGILHEEMWSNDRTDDSPDALNLDSELYQIWLNLPSHAKMTKPRVQLLRPSLTTPSAVPEEVDVIHLPQVEAADGVTVRVLAGQVGATASKVETFSDVAIMHTEIAPGSTWDLPLPPDFTTMVYVRKGSGLVSSGGFVSSGTPIPLHDLAFFERHDYGGDPSSLPDGIRLTNSAKDASDFVDVLLLAGRPLKEPVATDGPFVMNTQEQLNQAFSDFSYGPLSRPWDHQLSDEKWREYVAGGL